MKLIQTVNRKKITRFTILAVILTAIWVGALFLADFVASSDTAQNLVSQFGYLGVLGIAIIAGINILLPVPAATFVPIFTAAGLWLPFIVIALVIGTTIADMIGYFVGRWSREFAQEHYPNTYQRILSLNENHHHFLLPFVFVYAAMIPFPNEAIIIPLAIVGIKFRKILIPLVLGNIVNQTALAYGASNIFLLVF